MNVLKFSKINNLLTEQHNLEIEEIKKVNIFGKDYEITNPCNLNIFTSCICPNHCSFCINSEYSNKDVSDEVYFSSLTKVLDELADKYIEITLTGGEPTLNLKRFVITMQECKKRNINVRTVSTTGFNLLKYYDNKPLYQHMIENDFIHNINISKMSCDDKINKQIMGPCCLNNSDINKIALFFKINNADLKISCNLLKENVHNLSNILDFIEFYNNIDTIAFHDLVGNFPNYLKDIYKEIINNNDFEFIKNTESNYYAVKIFKYKNYLIKYYKDKKQEKSTVINSLSLRNGVLKNGFNGEIIYKNTGE